jgi:hypothetical protein
MPFEALKAFTEKQKANQSKPLTKPVADPPNPPVQETEPRGGSLDLSRYKIRINRGLNAGESPYRLLIVAMAGLSKATQDPAFYDVGREVAMTVYGELGHEPAIEDEKEQVQKRLDRLTLALEKERDILSKKRIDNAIYSHKRRLDQLSKGVGIDLTW